MKKLSLSAVLESISNAERIALKDTLLASASESIEEIIRSVETMSDEELQNLGILDRKPIGNGKVGIVFNHRDKDRVVKITPISSDFDVADYVKGIPGILPIHEKSRIDRNKGNFLYRLVGEKMNPLEEIEKNFIDKLENEWKTKHGEDPNRDWNRSHERFRILKDFFIKNNLSMSPEERRTIKQVLMIIKNLHKKKVAFNDFKASQFMRNKNGDIVLVDLGALRFCGKRL